LARNGRHAMSDLSPQCAEKRTSAVQKSLGRFG
jgi:hypothetical protein